MSSLLQLQPPTAHKQLSLLAAIFTLSQWSHLSTTTTTTTTTTTSTIQRALTLPLHPPASMPSSSFFNKWSFDLPATIHPLHATTWKPSSYPLSPPSSPLPPLAAASLNSICQSSSSSSHNMNNHMNNQNMNNNQHAWTTRRSTVLRVSRISSSTHRTQPYTYPLSPISPVPKSTQNHPTTPPSTTMRKEDEQACLLLLTNILTYSFTLLALNPQTLFLALYYIRLLSSTPYFVSQNPDKLLLAGLILADSQLNDHPLSLKAWAAVAGLKENSQDILKVKQEALKSLDWSLEVKEGLWNEWVRSWVGVF
ncbi:hypothetical protein HDV05_007532 [Chytridiales sp. JEL 0842]|nr:hypothetical protein HDV05_007532 [Chytridiales sp. JEL 0842]